MKNIVLDDMEYVVKNIDYNLCEGKAFLIAGANGFLPSYIVEVLLYLNTNVLKEKCTVVALCRNEKDAKQKFGKYLANDNFILLNQSVEENIKYKGDVDYVIHAASRSSTSEFIKNPVGIISANVIGTYNLLEYSRKRNIEGFLFLSSGAVYGNIDSANEDIKETEYYPLNPLEVKNCYGESKKMAENMCYCFYKQYKTPIKIVRIGHTYGPGISLNDGRVFSDFVKNILNNENLFINSDGKSKRPFCYISDAVIAFFLILLNGKNGEAYNMANNNNIFSIGQLADLLTSKVFKEKHLKVVYSNNEYLTNFNKGQVSVDTNKLNELGWNPKIDVEEGFRRTVESFLERKENYEL